MQSVLNSILFLSHFVVSGFKPTVITRQLESQINDHYLFKRPTKFICVLLVH